MTATGVHSRIVQCIIDHPTWCSDEVATSIGCPSSTVRSVVNRLRITMPAKSTRPISKWYKGRLPEHVLAQMPKPFKRHPYAGKSKGD